QTAIINRAADHSHTGTIITAESGLASIRLARLCARYGLAGFEWAIGVPGTLGGAVVGNAGAHGGDMAGSVVTVEAITPAGPLTWTNDQLAFDYRSSRIKREGLPCVITLVVLKFEAGDPDAISARMGEFNAYRKRTQPAGATLGSTFKNPPGDHAGRLIDVAGLKGTQIGGARISEKHANFILNMGGATAADVMALADLARETVAKQFGVTLELEIEPVGVWEQPR
ncbi:MAG: UDP-N-acetylmuramate dehydrogenase, partial [Chloroflexi bacterium]|nr:UDP-N-acetylmuramate dehydrogenase [Chloroflexota bacterium]